MSKKNMQLVQQATLHQGLNILFFHIAWGYIRQVQLKGASDTSLV